MVLDIVTIFAVLNKAWLEYFSSICYRAIERNDSAETPFRDKKYVHLIRAVIAILPRVEDNGKTASAGQGQRSRQPSWATANNKGIIYDGSSVGSDVAESSNGEERNDSTTKSGVDTRL